MSTTIMANPESQTSSSAKVTPKSGSTKKASIYTMAVIFGLPVTFILFFVMASLISQPAKLGTSNGDENFIDFIRSVPQNNLQTRRRTLPKKPPAPKKSPKMPKLALNTQNDAPSPKMAMNVPLLSNSLSLGSGPYLGGGVGGSADSGGDQSLMPLIRIEPQYPQKAARSGKEGWVKLLIDINTVGGVENVSIVSSKPPRIFNQAAKRALLKWKYKPKIVDGKAVASKGIGVHLDFKLSN